MGEEEGKGGNGRKGPNHWAAKLQRGAIDELNARRTHPECGHTMARDQLWRREGTGLRGVFGGEKGEQDGQEAVGKLGRQIPPPCGGDLVFLGVPSTSMAHNGRHPASCKKEDRGREETTLNIEKEGVWCLEVQLVHLYTNVIYLAKDKI